MGFCIYPSATHFFFSLSCLRWLVKLPYFLFLRLNIPISEYRDLVTTIFQIFVPMLLNELTSVVLVP